MRVCLYGGPDSGKSTAAMGLCADFKRQGYSIELINEYSKDWAFEKREFKTPSDQFLVFAEQKRKEANYLHSGVKTIITDSPLLLAYCYSETRGFTDDLKAIKSAEAAFEKRYPSLNIFMHRLRSAETHHQEGRFHNFEECGKMDTIIYRIIKNTGRDIKEFDYNETDKMFAYIKEHIVEPKKDVKNTKSEK